jgi:integral membrane sensor domain MASE1
MEWKEHVAWLVPIAITVAAVVAIRHRNQLARSASLRVTLQGFVALSLVAAGIAGFFGAMLDKTAPVGGGASIQIVKGDGK